MLNGLILEVSEYPCTRKEMFMADEKTFASYQKQTVISEIVVPFRDPVATTEFVNAGGGVLSLSPLALDIKGLFPGLPVYKFSLIFGIHDRLIVIESVIT